MSLGGLFRSSPSDRRPATTAARRRPARRALCLEGLEERLVLSSAAATPATAQVHALATKSAQTLRVPITITSIQVATATNDAATGQVQFAGTLTGTVLGQTFTTPVSGTVAARGRGVPSLILAIPPLNRNLLGLGIQTTAIDLNLTARGAGALGKTVANDLKSIVASTAGRVGATPPLNALFANAQVLNALNKSLAQAKSKVASFTPAQGATASALGLTLAEDRVTSSGVTVALDSPQGKVVRVNLTGNNSGGLLGSIVGGLSGSTSSRGFATQVNGALQKVASTPVPTFPTTPTGGIGSASTPGATATATGTTLLTIDLKPLDVKLLGLEVKTSEIVVNVSAQPGSGMLLGNLLSTVSGLINLQGVSTALNNVLGNVVNLANAATLNVSGVGTTGPLITPTSTTPVPVLTAHVAPVHLNLLGAVVDTSPIDVSITANPGQGQVLGNAIAALSNLLNTPPKNGKLDIPFLTGQIQTLNNQLATLIPGIPAAPSPVHTVPAGTTNVLSLVVAPINLNLLGLVLKTDQIQVNADAATGNGKLLGNLLTDLLNTLNGTPDNMAAFNAQVNNLLAKVIGVLNATNLVLPANITSTLSQTLQTLALPNLVNTTGTPATAPVLDLNIASTTGSAPPIDVDLLGLVVTTSDVHAQLVAQTGDGQILGNLVYNVSHLLDPGGALGLLTILQALNL